MPGTALSSEDVQGKRPQGGRFRWVKQTIKIGKVFRTLHVVSAKEIKQVKSGHCTF